MENNEFKNPTFFMMDADKRKNINKSSDTKTILGIPYISNNSLIQDVIMLYRTKEVYGGSTLTNKVTRETQATVVLIENIWDKLRSASTGKLTLDVSGGNYGVELKSVGPDDKKSWYFKCNYTPIDPESTKEIDYIDIPIPKPDGKWFTSSTKPDEGFDFNPDNYKGVFFKYWATISKAAEESIHNTTNATVGTRIIANKTMEYHRTFDKDAEDNAIWIKNSKDYVKNIDIVDDGGLYERENPYGELGGLMSSFW